MLPETATRVYDRLSALPDDQVIREAREGSLEAFWILYQRYVDPVFQFLRESSKGDVVEAELLTEWAFCKFVQSIDRVDSSRPLRPYLLKIARNLWLDRKKLGVIKGMDLDLVPAQLETPEKHLLRGAQEQWHKECLLKMYECLEFYAALGAVQERGRRLLGLVYFEGLTEVQAAEVLSISHALARKDVSRAYAALRSCIEMKLAPAPVTASRSPAP